LPDAENPYVLGIRRAGGKVTVSCDGATLATLDAAPFLHGDLAIEVSSPQAEKTLQENATGETELRIYDFRATGALSERTSAEQQWRQRILPEYRQVRRIGNAMGYVADDPHLPRVLLIGDSISLYYTDPVRSHLAGRANVHRIPDNARMTSYGLEQMDKWLNGEKFDIIHFNFGLHDITRTSPKDYEKNLEQLVGILQRSGKRLTFATTTPVPAETKLITPALVDQYNAIAKRVMDRHNIPIDDLHGWMFPHVDQYKLFPGNEHFNSAGSTYLATKVTEALSEELGKHP
jgi:lysophospholipase L1-like esterase